MPKKLREVGKKFEILAPGGDVNACKAAILAGADAIFCGLNKFNARNRAANIEFDDLLGIIRLAHQHNCEVFLTMNILLIDAEFKSLFSLLNRLVNTNLDGIIVQDLGLFHLLSTQFPTLAIHASTQTTTHNRKQLQFLKVLGAKRANLSRELNVEEIKNLSTEASDLNMQTEVFVHGSNCLSFSGACFYSSVQSGNSGNRGRCSQPCRDKYQTTNAGRNYPLNLKDNAVFPSIKALLETGAYSLKIEGRIKKSDYVYTVVKAYREQVDRFLNNEPLSIDMTALHTAFNRDFTTGFLSNSLGKSVFIDNPRDYSVLRLAENKQKESVQKEQKALLDKKEKIKEEVKQLVSRCSTKKLPLTIECIGSIGQPLQVTVKEKDKTFTTRSLGESEGKEAFSASLLTKRLKAVEETDYSIVEIVYNNEEEAVYYPFKELNAIKKDMLLFLREGKPLLPVQELPKLQKNTSKSEIPKLKVLIDSEEKLSNLIDFPSVEIYYLLPSSPTKNIDLELVELSKTKNVVLYFPSIILDNDAERYCALLDQYKPAKIVTNNSGIAFHASKLGIDWIAGPQFNMTNSFSLQALQTHFHCSGAFVSNELNQGQIYPIKAPNDFELGYSLFHPSVLMTSRQCIVSQVAGCQKENMDESCLRSCEKSASLFDEKGNETLVKTSKGNHHTLYHQHHFLNLDILKEVKNKFAFYMIDLTEVKTNTTITTIENELIKLFQQAVQGDEQAVIQLSNRIGSTQKNTYKTGI